MDRTLENNRLTLVGRLKAHLLARRLRRRWEQDADWRESVMAAAKKAVNEKYNTKHDQEN